MNKKLEIIKQNKISLKSDFIFKKLFSENEDLLISLLKAILKINITHIEVIKDYSLDKFTEKEKGGVLDIKATIDDKLIVNIEMQVQQREDIVQRTMYYGSKIKATSINAGQEYEELKNITCISILDYINFEDEEADNFLSQSEFVMKQTNSQNEEIMLQELDSNFNIITIELPKFRKIAHNLDDSLHKWLLLIDCIDFKEMEEIMKSDKQLREAIDQLSVLMDDEQVMRAYDAEQDAIRTRKHLMRIATEKGLKQGMEQGIEQGIEKGLKQGLENGIKKRNIEVLKTLVNLNKTDNEICEILNIEINELTELKNELK